MIDIQRSDKGTYKVTRLSFVFNSNSRFAILFRDLKRPMLDIT